MTLSEKVEAMRAEAAKEGRLLPACPSCSAPWCMACNALRRSWAKLGVVIKCNDKI